MAEEKGTKRTVTLQPKGGTLKHSGKLKKS